MQVVGKEEAFNSKGYQCRGVIQSRWHGTLVKVKNVHDSRNAEHSEHGTIKKHNDQTIITPQRCLTKLVLLALSRLST